LFFLSFEREATGNKNLLGVSGQFIKNIMKKTKRSLWAKTKQKKQKSLGIHLIADFWGGEIIENPKKLEKIFVEAAKRSGNIPLKFSYHKFNPHGLTGVLLLAESHISFHSWPEFKYLALDVFSCGKNAQPEKALRYLKKVLKPKKIKIFLFKRGKLN
jgi:S-adenosylmethionine decarboxylase